MIHCYDSGCAEPVARIASDGNFHICQRHYDRLPEWRQRDFAPLDGTCVNCGKPGEFHDGRGESAIWLCQECLNAAIHYGHAYIAAQHQNNQTDLGDAPDENQIRATQIAAAIERRNWVAGSNQIRSKDIIANPVIKGAIPEGDRCCYHDGSDRCNRPAIWRRSGTNEGFCTTHGAALTACEPALTLVAAEACIHCGQAATQIEGYEHPASGPLCQACIAQIAPNPDEVRNFIGVIGSWEPDDVREDSLVWNDARARLAQDRYPAWREAQEKPKRAAEASAKLRQDVLAALATMQTEGAQPPVTATVTQPTPTIPTAQSPVMQHGLVVPARVIALDPARGAVVEAQIPGRGPQPMRAPAGDYQVGDTVHVQVEVNERFRVTNIAAPGDLGEIATTPLPQGVTVETARIALAGDLPPGIQYVQNPEHYYVTDQVREYVGGLLKMSAKGKYVRAALMGPTGAGKTTLAYYMAALDKRPFAKINCGSKQSPEAFFGMRTLTKEGTGFQWATFARALSTPRTVIFLEEFNRTHASNHSSLMEVLDDTLETWIDEIQEFVRVDKSVIVLAAMNIGATYSGTFSLDEAMEGRLSYPLELGYLPPVEEAKVLVMKTGVSAEVATAMVEIANETRRLANDETENLDRAIATRALLDVGDLITKGELSPAAAFRNVILPRFDNEGGTNSQRAQVGKIVQGHFGS